MRCATIYKSAGIFSSSARIFNSISFVELSAVDLPDFVVEVPIEGAVIEIATTVRLDHTIDLIYSTGAGSNVEATWYINGSAYNESSYQPLTEGLLEVMLVLVNNFNNSTVSKLVEVETQLQAINFLPHNPLPLHYLNSPLEFTLGLVPEAAYHVTYNVDMGDGTVYHDLTVSHLYADIGVYDITINASNSLSTTHASHSIDVQDKILRVMIKGSLLVETRVLTTYIAEVYKESTAHVVDNVHYVWKIDGVTQEQDAGDLSVLLENSGIYTLNLQVYNSLSSHEVSEQLVVVDDITCPPPDSYIAGTDTLTLLTTDTVTLEAVISANCNNTHTAVWQVLTLDREQVIAFNESTSKVLKFEAAALNPGTYIVRLVVHVADDVTIYRSDEILLSIEEVSVILNLNYPTFTTTNTKESLAISLRDSEVLNKTLNIDSFSFAWSCSFKPPADYDPCLALDLLDSPDISAQFNISGFADISVVVSLAERQVGSAYLVLNVTNYVVPLVKITVADIHALAPDKRTVVSLGCTQHDQSACYNPTIYWLVSLVSQEACPSPDSSSRSYPSSTFTLEPGMTTTGLYNSNLVVNAGVFERGGVYKVSGCVWQGVCGGEILQFSCGPTAGTCSADLQSGKLTAIR